MVPSLTSSRSSCGTREPDDEVVGVEHPGDRGAVVGELAFLGLDDPDDAVDRRRRRRRPRSGSARTRRSARRLADHAPAPAAFGARRRSPRTARCARPRGDEARRAHQPALDLGLARGVRSQCTGASGLRLCRRPSGRAPRRACSAARCRRGGRRVWPAWTCSPLRSSSLSTRPSKSARDDLRVARGDHADELGGLGCGLLLGARERASVGSASLGAVTCVPQAAASSSAGGAASAAS